MDVDVDELSAEIRQIDYEYRQTNDRLFEVFGRGRRRGRGRTRGRGRGRLVGRGFLGPEGERWQEDEGAVPEPRVASSIVGPYREDVQRDFIPPVILKRPATHAMDDDPKVKNRNRRMFSSLLTTLEKFREENDTVEQSERWKKREEISKRTQEKTKEESNRLREKQRKEWEEQKQQETEKLKELDLMRKVKGLQLIYAKRRQHHELLLHYLPTDAAPVVYWTPAKHNDVTQAMMDAKVEAHTSWLEEQQQNFEKQKLRIENGQPLEEEEEGTTAAEEPRIKSTIQVPTNEGASGADDEADMQFQPVSELDNVLPEAASKEEEEASDAEPAPPAKKPKLNEADQNSEEEEEEK